MPMSHRAMLGISLWQQWLSATATVHWWLKHPFTGAALYTTRAFLLELNLGTSETTIAGEDPPASIKRRPQHLGVRLGIRSVLDGDAQRMTLGEPQRCTKNHFKMLKFKSRRCSNHKMMETRAGRRHDRTSMPKLDRQLRGTTPQHENVSEWWVLWCWELIWSQQL